MIKNKSIPLGCMGNKTTELKLLLPIIEPQINNKTIFIEPFCGSCVVSYAVNIKWFHYVVKCILQQKILIIVIVAHVKILNVNVLKNVNALLSFHVKAYKKPETILIIKSFIMDYSMTIKTKY